VAEPNYISQAGAEKLRAERDHLLDVERPQVVNTVAAAAAEGDRSENAEYIYGKRRLAQIDKRAEFLTARLDAAEIVPAPTSADDVVFLSWVVVEDEEGDEHTFRIVGADEVDPGGGHISWRSPVGRALLRRRLDDEIHVDTPRGTVSYTIVGIHTQDPREFG